MKIGFFKVIGNHANEFIVSPEIVNVTESHDKWIISLDGKPASQVYRKLQQMTDKELFTSDWQHPIGVAVPATYSGICYNRNININIITCKINDLVLY